MQEGASTHPLIPLRDRLSNLIDIAIEGISAPLNDLTGIQIEKIVILKLCELEFIELKGD
ncbi:hypothetical protein BST97_04350 [Nonlabens spongiae]|uniref:Uncharacterized protein n=1 Tax=Nonlabens spongiae TaxID=331648 RepID=A0A1W6MI53_9FLAO|nr:hypothetical protein BST97_04350 [Nonlabens spongiae]